MTSRSARDAAGGGWDFPYEPLPTAPHDDDGGPIDVVVATETAVPGDALESALRALAPDVRAVPILARAPLFWTRVVAQAPARRAWIAKALADHGVAVRYVASARRGSTALAPALADASPAAPDPTWTTRDREHGPRPRGDGSWFLDDGPGGVGADRAVCGWGAGTRLAVIDDDAAFADALDLDAEVLVSVDRARRASQHGTVMVAWATEAARPGFAAARGAERTDEQRAKEGFDGVAPAASTRLYHIPKPGDDVVSLALAIVRAVLEGADVIVCATYVEGSHGPLLDDALELAHRAGRSGRGTPVVLPTGREARSPRDSVHGSYSLSLADVASDPRAVCVGPSARGSGWFHWRDRNGRLRPFANRGPAVRWLAPGDDIAHPLFATKMCHAESSGAAAIAAGVLLLVLANNPRLTAAEAALVVDRTTTPVTDTLAERELADAADALPLGRDADGHDAKHGHGIVNARRAVLVASDPICAALVSMGEDGAAEAWLAHARAPGFAYDEDLARELARVVVHDDMTLEALKVVARHLRLLSGRPDAATAHATGAIARHLALALRRIVTRVDAPTREDARVLLSRCEGVLAEPRAARAFEASLVALATSLWPAAESLRDAVA